MISFIKARGLGNDFVMLEEPQEENLSLLSQKIADRRKGVGCDQVIYFQDFPQEKRAKVRFFNNDGSEAESCGNGSRCLAKWLMTKNMTDFYTLDTLGGILECTLSGQEISVTYPIPKVEKDLATPETEGPTDAVFLGNPHLVCFTQRLDELELRAPELENHPYFPQKTNVGFAKMTEAQTLDLRVWERGSGLTPACGSGACAAAYAAFKRGLALSPVSVRQQGGNLKIDIGEKSLTMTGEARITFEGQLDLSHL
jgi:diaminopimelate epimerase